VLVLIVTQLGVSDKVASITADSEITQKDVDQAQSDLEQQQQEVAELQRRAAAVADINMDAERQRLDRMQELLATKQNQVEQQTEILNEFAMKIESNREQAVVMQQEIEQTEASRLELDAAIRTALEQRVTLTALLDDTAETRNKKTTRIRIPHPRPPPEGAKEATFICAHEKLFPLRLDYHRQYAAEACKQIIESQQLDLDPEAGIDPQKFEEFLSQVILPNDDFFRAEYYIVDNRWPRIRFHPNVERGATVKSFALSRSEIRQLIRTLNPQQLYCRFHVLPDSYEVYIAARRAVTDQELLAGWEPQSEGWTLTTSIPGIELGPPRPKPPPPAVPPPPRKRANLID